MLCASLALTACGSGGSAAAGTGGAGALDEGLPTIEVPQGSPPKHLVVRDLVEGSGRPVKATDNVAVRYVAAAYRTGKQFDYRFEPFYFQVGLGRVMPGFDRGVLGMREGGRRELIIPPNLTYDEAGKGETLIYVIDLLGFESGAEYKQRLKTGEPAPFP